MGSSLKTKDLQLKFKKVEISLRPDYRCFNSYISGSADGGNVEACMEGALLSYSSLGPLVLICKRKDPKTYCSTAIQYQLIRHYENYSVLMRYLLSKKHRPLPEWYDEHIAESKLSSTGNPSEHFLMD